LAEHHNPNQQGAGSDTRSTFTFFLVMMLAFLGWQFYTQKTAKPAATSQAPTANPVAPGPAAAPASSTSTSSAPVPTTTSPVIAANDESETIVENELYRITFTNRGGHVLSWILKRYKDSEGHPLDLVDPVVAKKYGYPLSMFTYTPALTATLNQALYQPSASGALNSTTAGGTTLSYEYASGTGLVVHKTFHFDATYVVHADTVVTQNGAPVRALINWPSGLGDQGAEIAANKNRRGSSAPLQIDESRYGKTSHFNPNKVSGGATADGELDWAGIGNLYFTVDFLPDAPADATIVTENTTQRIALDPSKPDVTQPSPLLGIALGDLSGHTQTRIFAGPKDIYVLDKIHPTGNSSVSLEPVVNFGWAILSPISKVLFMLLHWTYEHVLASWGWSIVILTVVINLVFLPLRISQMRSALKMQRIQPQVAAINERYKKYKVTDPQMANKNSEISALYQKENVNIFGGCLPLLVQMPLLFAFYGMLSHSIELRQTHWYWLPDLSSADPYHILPIIMVLSQFLVQFYTPSPGMDPQQAKMMAFTMPAVTGFITWNYASGLALYWAVGNGINIIQQLIMNRTSLGKEMREIAMKRARRKPQTIQARR